MMSRLKIRYLLLVLFGMISIITLGSLAQGVVVTTQGYGKAGWLKETNALADAVIRANAMEAIERGMTATALSDPAAVTTATRTRIAELRAEGDRHVEDAWRHAAQIKAQRPDHPLHKSVAEAERRRAELEEARRQADRTIDTGKASLAAPRWVAIMSAYIDAMAQVRRDAFVAKSPLDEAYRNNLQIKEIVFMASEYAGRERATVGSLIAGGKPIAGEVEMTLRAYRGIVDRNLETLALLARDLPETSPTRRALEGMTAEFLGRFQQLRQSVYAAGQSGAAYPIDGATWVTESTRGIDSILGIADAVSLETIAAVTAAERESVRGLIMVLLGALVSVGIVAYAAVTIHRRVLVPLIILTKASHVIAEGVLDREIRHRSQDELGELAESFEQMRRYLKEVADVAEAMSRGDLSRDVVPQSERDQFGVAIAEMSRRLRGVITEVRRSAQSVAAAAEQSDAATQLTSASIEQMAASIAQVSGNSLTLAAAVDETSSSIEEMTSSIQQVSSNVDNLSEAVGRTSASVSEMAESVQQVALNVSEASRVAERATEVAGGGQQAVSQTVDGMGQIRHSMEDVVQVIGRLGRSSAEIGNIISVIDDIAEQTNLLALNAAIEAARAGEHGRGFAVVADEVRKLAERSAKATGEIAALIQGIQKETAQAVQSTHRGEAAIQQGTALATAAGEALQEIVGSVQEVTQLMSRITETTGMQSAGAERILGEVAAMNQLTQHVALASREQALGSAQIMTAVASMNRMTQQVSGATAEQKVGAEQVVVAVDQLGQMSRGLQAQAQGLLEVMGFFQDSRSGDGSAVAGAIEPPRALLAAASGARSKIGG